MTATLYISATADREAAETQETHAADAEGWCGFCLRHFRIRVRAGECWPYRLAARVRAMYARQQGPRVSVSSPRPGRVWST